MILLLGILIFSSLLYSSYEGDIDIVYKIVSIDTSKEQFKVLNQEETGLGIENFNLKIFTIKNKFYLTGSGLGSSYPNRNFHIKLNFDNKIKFRGFFDEKIYYFKDIDLTNQKRYEKYSLRKLNIFGEYNISNNFSLYLENFEGRKKGTSLKSYFLLGSLIGYKKETNYKAREINFGGRINEKDYFLEICQGIVQIDNFSKREYLYILDDYSSNYLSNPEGFGKDNYDDYYPKTNLSFSLLKNNFKIISNFNYFKGSIKGKTDEEIYFNFGENAQLISSSTFNSNYKNKFENISSNINLSYSLNPVFKIENYIDYEKENLESEILANSLLIFTDPESGFSIELPYKIEDVKSISVERFLMENNLNLFLFEDFSFSIAYNIASRKIDEEVKSNQTEHSFDLGFHYSKKFIKFDGSFKKGKFSSSYFKTEPKEFDGYFGKLSLKFLKYFSFQGIIKDYNSNSIDGDFKSSSIGGGILFSKGNYFVNLLYINENYDSKFPIDFDGFDLNIYKYEGKNFILFFNLPLSEDFKFEGSYSMLKDKGKIYPFEFVNAFAKISSSEIFKNLKPFFQVRFLNYENYNYSYLNAKGIVYYFGMNLRINI